MSSKYLIQNVRIPKQWNHWLRNYGFKPHVGKRQRRRSAEPMLYFKGKGRVWRITSGGLLQCGDTYDRFDRWALTDVQVHRTLPHTFREFKLAVTESVQEAEHAHSNQT